MAKQSIAAALNDLFDAGTDFRLSGRVYEERTGKTLPKEKSYLKNNSALAKLAKEKGYIIDDVQETPVIEKTVFFKKKEG